VEPDPTTRLVVVPDAREVDRRDARSEPVQEQEREAMPLREPSEDGSDVIGTRRV
jgi:hypothetical protein